MKFKVGDIVIHRVMGWRGVIVKSLENNPYTSRDWTVVFDANGRKEEHPCQEPELRLEDTDES